MADSYYDFSKRNQNLNHNTYDYYSREQRIYLSLLEHNYRKNLEKVDLPQRSSWFRTCKQVYLSCFVLGFAIGGVLCAATVSYVMDNGINHIFQSMLIPFYYIFIYIKVCFIPILLMLHSVWSKYQITLP